MEINHILAFYHVAKAGGFTQAARQLRISQPSLSKSVGLLEAREGIRLLERSKRGVRLTKAGEKVFIECESLILALERIQKSLSDTQATLSGFLRIAASDHIANYLLPKVVIEFQKEHPEVFPSIYTGTPRDIGSEVLNRQSDIGLFFTPFLSTNLSIEPILQMEFLVVGSKRAAKTAGNILMVGSIQRDYHLHPAQTLIEGLGRKGSLAFESNNQEVQKRLAVQGECIAVLPRFMIEKELGSGQLIEIPGFKAHKSQLHWASRANSESSPLVATFRKTLLRALSTK